MKNYYLISKRNIGLIGIFTLLSAVGLTQTLMPIPAQSSTYTGNTRGFWFQSPTDFMMVGVRVPTDASTDDQSIAVVRFNSGPPPAYASTTNDFTVLALFQDVPGNSVLAVNIPVYTGDYIGILGSRGASSTNSYGAGNFSTTILGEPVTLLRMGMQYNLESTNPQNLWTENSSLSRVEMYYTTLIIDDYPYCEHFETGEGSYTAAGTFLSWEYGEPVNTVINAAASGDNAWVTNLDGDYNNNELSFVQSPEFDLTALVDPVIRFQNIRALQSGTDGVAMQVSIDSGFVWTTLGSASSPSPWYNSGSISALTSVGSSAGWTGSSSGWVDMRHSLSTYASDTSVFFRFVLASNGSVVNEGFGFDDIIIAESNDVALMDLIYEDSVCGVSSHPVNAVICNKSIEEKSGFSVDVDTNGTINTYNYPDTLGVCECDTVEVFSFNSSAGGFWNLSVEIDNTGDVNSANDVISGDILSYSIPGGSISAGTGPFCAGDAVELTFNFTGSGPWNCVYTNGVGNFNAGNVSSPYTAFATISGNYEIVSLTDATGCAGDSGTFGNGVNIVINPIPDPDLGNDTTICGTYVIDAGPGTSYLWNTGATTQTLVITNPGTYAVTVTDANGCEGYDDVNLDVNPLPVIAIEDTVLCDGGTFLFNAGGPFISYLWDDGSTGQVRVVTGLVTVSVTVTDFNGCTNSKSASITEIVDNPDPVVKNVEGHAPVTLDAGNGYAAYYWNTGQQTQTITVYASGTFTCTVTDENGCKGSDNGKASIWPNSIEDVVLNEGVALYPNPVQDAFELRFARAEDVPAFITLMDMSGRQVATFALNSGSTHQRVTLPTGLAAGSYVVSLGGKLSRDIPIVIQKQ